jgi:dTDP-4-dehydrorhamnose reductase
MRLLLTGASGQLGAYVLLAVRDWKTDVVAWSGSRTGELFGRPLRPVDLADAGAVAAAFREAGPDVVLHAGALTSVAGCHRDPRRARQVNAEGTATLADLAARAGARLVLVSTDLVFDGEGGSYREEDPVSPLSVYGRTKVAAEQAVLACPGGVVVRVSLLFGPTRSGRPAFFDEQAAALREGRPVTLFHDEWRTPLALSAAARGLLAVASSGYTGLWHMGGPERMSRLEMGRRLAACLGLDPAAIVPASRESAPAAEPRPRDTSLDSSRWRSLSPEQDWPDWDEALRQMISA